nr:type VI secretion system membrane subunit TssM [Methylomarinum sp. Ch1-1]MDP4520081.1 type VI secretion system membrane subunit TssM [Methylomarinum sp. Ch1-1]
MKKVINFCKNKWVIQFLGITALCLLIWFLAPLIAVGGKVLLESELSRWVVILIIFIGWLLNILRLQIKAGKTNAQLTDELSQTSEKTELQGAPIADQEVGDLKNHFDNALQTLKTAKHKTSAGNFYLYELPWYIIIGPPGCGKTTALVNSGLEFPLAGRFGKNAVQGIGGTRNCDWWFTDQAVMLDTAGRYTTQDSHEATDKAAWSGFLQLLKKYRPRRPLNGVLVAMSLSDLLKFTEQERAVHAHAIRQRVQELNEQLGIRVPVYMMFTKADLVAGFMDYFADLGKEERAQVWGVTFPEYGEGGNDSFIERFGDDYQQLLSRLDKGLLKRMQEERDLGRRQSIFGFPQRMALLKEPLNAFLQDCFGANRYQTPPLLRGVYLTSGTQEGTPIDRLMGVLANTFKLQRASMPVFSGKGKSYFLTRLLKEVIFAESELVGLNKKVEQRRTLLQRLFYGAAVATVVVFCGLWTHSFIQNDDRIDQFVQRAQHYQTLPALSQDGNATDFLPLLAKMDALRSLRDTYPKDDVPLTMRMGLYQGGKLRPVAESAYIKLLQQRFLPMIKTRLEHRLLGTESSNPEILYQLLRVYLMLGATDKAEISVIRPWIRVDWSNQYPQETEQHLSAHLDALLARPLPPQNVDRQLIGEVRKILTRVPVAQQIYMRIKEEALRNHDDDFRLSEALGISGSRVFSATSGSLDEVFIPGFFTYRGFHQVFLNESKDLAKQTVEQRWVLGDENVLGVGDSKQLEGKLIKYYYNEFIKRWDDMLASLRIRRTANIHQSVEVLETVSSFDSPLRKLLQALDKQTSLTRVSASAPLAAVDKLKQGVEAGGGDRMQKLLSAAKSAGVEVDSVDRSGKEVERHFQPLVSLVRQSGPDAPIDQIIANLGQLYAYMADLGTTSNTGEAAMNLAMQRSGGGGNDIIAKLQLQASRLPEPMKGWVKTLASANWGLILGGVKGQLNKALQSELGDLCNAGLEGRYPLVKSSQSEITLQDFGKFFAPNGLIDQFFNTHLKQFVDTSGRRWKLISQDNQSIGISASTLRTFQNAAKIKEIFSRQVEPCLGCIFN